MPPHQHRKCADVILVRVRDENQFRIALCDRSKIWKRAVPFLLRVHSAIEHKLMPARFDEIRICANLSVARQVNEFQFGNLGRAT